MKTTVETSSNITVDDKPKMGCCETCGHIDAILYSRTVEEWGWRVGLEDENWYRSWHCKMCDHYHPNGVPLVAGKMLKNVGLDSEVGRQVHLRNI